MDKGSKKKSQEVGRKERGFLLHYCSRTRKVMCPVGHTLFTSALNPYDSVKPNVEFADYSNKLKTDTLGLKITIKRKQGKFSIIYRGPMSVLTYHFSKAMSSTTAEKPAFCISLSSTPGPRQWDSPEALGLLNQLIDD